MFSSPSFITNISEFSISMTKDQIFLMTCHGQTTVHLTRLDEANTMPAACRYSCESKLVSEFLSYKTSNVRAFVVLKLNR